MWIKIISKRKYRKMLEEIESQRQSLQNLMSQHQNLHTLHQGLWKRFKNETDTRDKRIESLELALRREEHAHAEALKKLKKYGSKEAGK